MAAPNQPYTMPPQGYQPYQAPSMDGMDPLQQLEAHRKAIFQSIQSLQGLSTAGGNPQLAQLQSDYAQGMQGNRPIYSDAYQQNQIGQQVAGIDADRQAQSDIYRRAWANAGMSGGGMEASGLAGLQSRANQQTRNARMNVTNAAQLANVQEQARYQQQQQQLQAQTYQQEQQRVAMDVQARGQMHATLTEEENKKAADAAKALETSQQQQAQQANPYMGANPFMGAVYGRPSGLVGSPQMLAGENARYQENVQRQQRQADDWYNQQAQWNLRNPVT